MAKPTVASLEARIVALEALVASLSTPKPQAPATPKLALKREVPAPVVTYFVRGGQRWMKTRCGNRSVERLADTPVAPTPSYDEEYGYPVYDDEGSNYYLGE